jgi:hypothetical protein
MLIGLLTALGLIVVVRDAGANNVGVMNTTLTSRARGP